jgi:flagellar hook-associated protein FlgK
LHNVGNVAQEDYIRRDAILTPIEQGGFALGSKSSVRAAIDESLTQRLISAIPADAAAEVMSEYNQQIEQIISQPGRADGLDNIASDVQTAFAALLTSTKAYERQQIVATLERYLTKLQDMSTALYDLQATADMAIEKQSAEANSILDRIAAINQNIDQSNDVALATSKTSMWREVTYMAKYVSLRLKYG